MNIVLTQIMTWNSKILSPCDTYQVSIFDNYYNFITGPVGSLIPPVVLCVDTIYSPIYQSNIGSYTEYGS